MGTPPFHPTGTERALLAAILVVFFLMNFFTVARMPIPWGDEVMFTDPVANWYLGRGFVSGTWNIQRLGDFFAGYPPLYQLALMGWLSLFGMGPVAVRSLNLVAAVILGLVLWAVSWRTGLLSSVKARLLFVVAALGGYGVFVAYRSGRPDCVGMLICAGSVLTWMSYAGAWRFATLFVLGLLLPLAGLQIVFYAALMYALLCLLWPRPALVAAIPQGLGAMLGAILLVTFYVRMGVFEDFLAQTVGWQTVLGRAGTYDLRHNLGGLRDPSTLVASICILLVAVTKGRHGSLRFRSPEILGALVAIVVPISLFFVGKYPIYYAWMVYLPVLFCLAAALDQPLTGNIVGRRLFPVWFGAGYLVSTCSILLFTLVAVLQWNQRDPKRIENLVRPHIRRQDRVLLDHAAYYACVGRVAAIYDSHYSFAEQEAQTVSLLVVNPWNAPEYQKRLGGEWIDTGAELNTLDERPQFPLITYIFLPTPDLRVYRRKEAAERSVREEQGANRPQLAGLGRACTALRLELHGRPYCVLL